MPMRRMNALAPSMAMTFSAMMPSATPRIVNRWAGAGNDVEKITRIATTTGETRPGIVIGVSAGIQRGSASGGGEGGGEGGGAVDG